MWCLGKCVGLGFMLQLEKLQLIYTTHIKKVIAKLYSFSMRRKKMAKNNRTEIYLDTGLQKLT